MKLIFLALLFLFSFFAFTQSAKAPGGYRVWNDPDKALRDPKNSDMKRQLDDMLNEYIVNTAKRPTLSLQSVRTLASSTQFVKDKSDPLKLVSGQRVQYDVILKDSMTQKTEGVILYIIYSSGPGSADLESSEQYSYP